MPRLELLPALGCLVGARLQAVVVGFETLIAQASQGINYLQQTVEGFNRYTPSIGLRPDADSPLGSGYGKVGKQTTRQ
jgi:hypothetical protein